MPWRTFEVTSVDSLVYWEEERIETPNNGAERVVPAHWNTELRVRARSLDKARFGGSQLNALVGACFVPCLIDNLWHPFSRRGSLPIFDEGCCCTLPFGNRIKMPIRGQPREKKELNAEERAIVTVIAFLFFGGFIMLLFLRCILGNVLILMGNLSLALLATIVPGQTWCLTQALEWRRLRKVRDEDPVKLGSFWEINGDFGGCPAESEKHEMNSEPKTRIGSDDPFPVDLKPGDTFDLGFGPFEDFCLFRGGRAKAAATPINANPV